MEEFADAIAYEVKQEMANRYFGFRTRIENQSKEYLAKLLESSRELELGIRLDLCRIQFLLQEPRLFCEFLRLTGLPKEYALSLTKRQASAKIQELFVEMRGEGFTRWRRFRGLALTVYRSLAERIVAYRNAYFQLQEEHDELCQEIIKFQRNNNLSDILCFLRNFDSPDSERLKFLHSNTSLGASDALEQELSITPPAPIADAMLLLDLLPQPNQIKGRFTELLKQAFTRHHCSGQMELPF